MVQSHHNTSLFNVHSLPQALPYATHLVVALEGLYVFLSHWTHAVYVNLTKIAPNSYFKSKIRRKRLSKIPFILLSIPFRFFSPTIEGGVVQTI